MSRFADGVFVAVEWLTEQVIKDWNDPKEIFGSSWGVKMTKPMDTNFTYIHLKNKWRLWNNNSDENRNARFGLVLKPM